VSVTASGSTFTTSIDGVQVDSFTDSTYPSGGVGFREYNGATVEAGDFDNVSVVAADGTTLLSDDFSSSALTQWVPPLAGIKISTDSCGGQPSFVAQLAGADGAPVYLYASDLWDFHTNEALANYYWQPLRFGSDGAIEPLTCANSAVALATRPVPAAPPTPGEDQTSADGAFSPSCVVTADHTYGQTFTAGRTGLLSSVSLNVFRDGTEDGRILRQPPSQPLLARLTTVTSTGAPGATLATTTVPADDIGWSGRQVRLQPHLRVARGERLAIVLATSSPVGCYGVELDPTNPYGGGSALADGVPVPGSDLRFTTTVGGPTGTPPPTDPHAATAVLAPESGDVPALADQLTSTVLHVANLTDRAARVPVRVTASPGYEVSAPRTVTVGVGENRPLAVTVRRAVATTADGTLTVAAGAGRLTVPITATDDVVRTAAMSASSTHSGWDPARTNDGQIAGETDYTVWNAGAGWNDNDKSVWPDTLTATWAAPVTVGRVVVRTLDAPAEPASSNGLRDYEVQARENGAWVSVASVTGATTGTITSTFPAARTDALRLVISDSNDHGYSRVVELEGYAS
jgi:hypothetical protein